MSKISLSASAESKTAPRALAGKNICALGTIEKENPLIKKLLERIRKPSAREAEVLANFRIFVCSGKCRVFLKQGNVLRPLRAFNLGTKQTPAFFYRKYIFVFDKKLGAFVPADINVVYFNDRYVLGNIADNLFFKFDVKGIAPMGHVQSVHVFDSAYVVTTFNEKGNIAVYGFGARAQKFFEVKDDSYFEVTEQGVNLKDESGCIEATYQPKNGLFVCF